MSIAHSSEASIDARTAAIMAEAERQLAKQQRDDKDDIPRDSEAAQVQVRTHRSIAVDMGWRGRPANKPAQSCMCTSCCCHPCSPLRIGLRPTHQAKDHLRQRSLRRRWQLALGASGFSLSGSTKWAGQSPED